MAIALHGQSSANCGATRTTTAIAPAVSPVSDGDVMVAYVCTNNNTVVVTPPGGWTEFAGSPFHDTASATIAAFYRVASGESGTYSFSLGATTRSWNVWVGAYSGADTTTIPDVTPTSAASGTVPSMTTDTDGCMIVICGDYSSGAGATTTFTPPANFTEEVDQHTATASTENSQFVGDWLQPTAGATGAMAIVGVSTPTGCFGVALKPGGAGGAVYPVVNNPDWSHFPKYRLRR